MCEIWNILFSYMRYAPVCLYKIQKILLSYMKYAPICSYMKYRNIDLGLISGSGSSSGEGNVYHSSIFAWRIHWTEEPGRLHLLPVRKAMTNLDSVLKSRDIRLPTKVSVVKVNSQDREAS